MKFTKILATVCAVTLAVSALGTTVFAGEYVNKSKNASDLGHSSFDRSWKDYGDITIGDNTYEFTIGFNTFLTDEDYINDVYSQDKGYTYYGKIKNSEGSTDVTNKKSDNTKTSKADIKHTGKTITYYVYARKN